MANETQPTWSVQVIYFFASGEFYGRTVFRGTEAECDAHGAALLAECTGAHMVNYPKFTEAPLTHWEINVHHSLKPHSIWKVAPVGRG